MLNLVLSILFSSFIFVIFKLFHKFGVQTLFAIIVNYFVAALVGLLFYSGTISVSNIPSQSWFYSTLILGFLFIVVFNLMAKTAQTVGVAAASVATKMSFILPVLVGVLLFNEALSILKVLGMLLAIAAVYLTSKKQTTAKNAIKKEIHVLLLPVFVFLGSGLIDISLKYLQEKIVPSNELSLFSATVFLSAGIIGVVFIGVTAIKQPLKINIKNILGGIALGVPNFFSIYFLLKALEIGNLNSASIFTLNNVAIVLCSTFLGILLFKEKLIRENWQGIALAVTSIILVALF